MTSRPSRPRASSGNSRRAAFPPRSPGSLFNRSVTVPGGVLCAAACKVVPESNKNTIKGSSAQGAIRFSGSPPLFPVPQQAKVKRSARGHPGAPPAGIPAPVQGGTRAQDSPVPAADRARPDPRPGVQSPRWEAAATNSSKRRAGGPHCVSLARARPSAVLRLATKSIR